MDTIKTTVTEDALAKDVKHLASAGTCEMSSSEKPDKETSFNTEKEAKANREETDDLLEKIEEVVNDKINSEIVDNDISESSEHDFIKKIEEMENEVEGAKDEKGPSKSKENKKECDSDRVIVGKLVMAVSSDDKNDSNKQSKNLVSNVCENTGKNVILTEVNKGVETELKKVDSTTEKVKENKPGETSTCSDTKAGSVKSGEKKDIKNVIISSNESAAAPDTKTDKKSVPSEESIVATSEKKSEETLAEKSSTDSCDKASESIKTKQNSLENRNETPKTANVSSKGAEAITKPTESCKETKCPLEATKEKLDEVCKKLAPESKTKDEPMVIDLCDASDEPMDVDAEEKMDVDAISDDICEINDEEMKPTAEIVQSKPKTTTVAEDKIIDLTGSSKSSDKAEAVKADKIEPKKTVLLAPHSQVKENPKLTDEAKKQLKNETAVGLKHNSETIEKLPKNKSPIAPKIVSVNTVSIAEISATATSQLKEKHKKEEKASASQSSLKETIEAKAKKTEDDCLALTKGLEKKSEPEKKLLEEKSDKKTKSSTPEKKDGAGGLAKSVEQDSTEGKNNSNKEIKKKELGPVKPQEEVSKDIKMNKDINTEKSKKETESSKNENTKQGEVRKEEILSQLKSTSTTSVQPESVKPADIKDHHSSDSTSSLNSTVDEQIIKFGTETTIPGVELDREHPIKKIENKPLINMMKHGGSTPSLNTTPVTGPNVFNSTPIQKQFEISSENVSKISETNETSRTEKTAEDDANLHKSSKPEYSSESGTTFTTASHQSSSDHPDSGHQSSDGIAKYMNVIKKYNGITESTTDDDESTTNVKCTGLEILPGCSGTDLKKDSLYEINVWFDKNDIAFLSVEKVEMKKMSAILLDKTSGEGSQQASSSNGSVTSLPPFNLPTTRVSEVSSSSSSVNPSTPSDGNEQTSKIKKNILKIQGISQLCNFMIDEFTKIKKSLHPEELHVTIPKELKGIEEEPTTPKTQSKEPAKKNLAKGKSASPAMSESSPSPVRAEKRSRKRSYNKSQSEEEDEGKSKAKQPRKSQSKSHGTPSKEIESAHCDLAGQCVLAKWVDKKYYAGKITGEKPGNKFVVLFEDGASKVLPKDSIVFGEGDSLPLKDCSVHALVDDDYECGIVLSVDKVDDKILYTVKAETKTVKVTASDIYLQDDQAKVIQNVNAQKNSSSTSPDELISSRPTRNKRASTSPVTPEPGFSGGVGKKGAKRQKRISLPKLNRISESSDLSDQQETTLPSPDSSLELVEGVQPELQKTQKEAELCKRIFIADYLDFQPSTDPIQMFGPLPTSKTLFKNKYFILTCSLGLKPHRFVEMNISNVNERNRQFSKIPFVKTYIQKQIEEAGGIVFNHFDDVPRGKYRHCKLIAPRPCTTAKYIQCLAADIQAVSHEWIVESCRANLLQDFKKYVLPSGWSVVTKTFIRWTVGKASDQRQSSQPFTKITILIASEHTDFVTFWSRVCKIAGAIVRYVKYIEDVTESTKGYMVTDLDFPHIIQSKALHFGIPVVSTVWIVQSLIMGKVCSPDSSPKLTQMYPDDDY